MKIKLPVVSNVENVLPREKLASTFSAVELSKNEHNLIADDYFPVIISVKNYTARPIKNIRILVSVVVNAKVRDTDVAELPMTIQLEHPNLPGNHRSEMVVFNMAGCEDAILRLDSVRYSLDDAILENNGYDSNAPFLIKMTEMTNAYEGFQDQSELQIYILLKNYVDTNLHLRKLMLDLMYSNLEEINRGSFSLFGQKTNFAANQLNTIRALIQVDIISKIMMYIEDFIIMLIANLSSEGNYYRLLDKKDDDDSDLGVRILDFMSRLDSTEQGFTLEDYKRMLNYATPDTLDLSKEERESMNRQITENITSLRRTLLQIRAFGKDHSIIFRRYKHGGLPIRFDALSQSPYKQGLFDSQVIVFSGRDPLTEIRSLPYSHKVLEAYSCLISTLRLLIEDIVRNKISCLERGVSGILPNESYSTDPSVDVRAIHR